MSEREFETYLSFLCRLLRLDAKQREAIARELRDHLEERLEELQARGVARDEAVRRALLEFGDAAGLAAEFSSIARIVRRRWLMRMTLGTTIAAAAVAMATMALWPESSQPGPAPQVAVAQEAAQPAASPTAPPVVRRTGELTIEGGPPLARRINADFIEVPLRDVLDFLSDAVGGQFYVNEKRLAADEIPLDAPVTLELQNVRADMLLELALKQASDRLAYAVREGVVMISTLHDLEGAAEVRVYNVRDLLRLPATAGMADMMGAAGMPGGYGGGESGYGNSYGGAEGYGSAMAPSMSSPALSLEHRAAMLTQVIIAAVGRNHWNQENRDYGTIASYDGMLVVNHNTRVHHQVERLLEMLRSAAAEGKAAASNPPAPGPHPPVPGAEVERNDSATREKFGRRIAAEYVETPLADVLEHLSDTLEVEIYANWKALEAADAPHDAPVTLNLSKIRGAMALELALAQAGEQLAYVIRDGVVVVSTVEDLDGAAMLRVYNCRDLLPQPTATPYSGAEMYGGGYNPYGAMPGGSPMGPGMGDPFSAAPAVSSESATRLVNILTSSIAPSSWESAGGRGTLAEYNGLIVVNHNERVHAQVEQVLKMVRQAAATVEKQEAGEPKP